MSSMTAVCQGTLSPETLAGIRYIKSHNSREQSESMSACVEQATHLESSYHHRFFGVVAGVKRATTGLNETRSPKLSPGGQYYLDCQTCGHTIFEDGTGSATERGCDWK